MTDPPSVAVIVPAAGDGTRLGGHRKQFRVLGGKSVLVQTLLVFERHPSIDHIIVATPPEAVAPLDDELRRVGISKLVKVVAGGESRQATVAAGLQAVPDSIEIVLVHDAVRPFVRFSKVTAVIEAAFRFGAGALAIPVTDTLRRVQQDEFAETVPREQLFCMQTPQGFRSQWLREAYESASANALPATDDVELVQAAGHRVHLVDGCPLNVKITTPEDWERATRFWNLWTEIRGQEERETISG